MISMTGMEYLKLILIFLFLLLWVMYIYKNRVKIVVEAANLPTSPSASEYLHKNDVWIIPDFIANAGGVIGSFVE